MSNIVDLVVEAARKSIALSLGYSTLSGDDLARFLRISANTTYYKHDEATITVTFQAPGVDPKDIALTVVGRKLKGSIRYPPDYADPIVAGTTLEFDFQLPDGIDPAHTVVTDKNGVIELDGWRVKAVLPVTEA